MNVTSLPKMIETDNTRCWLTLTCDINDNWIVGYADNKGRWLANKFVMGVTLEQAIDKLEKKWEDYFTVERLLNG
jgi:hypothetical protein